MHVLSACSKKQHYAPPYNFSSISIHFHFYNCFVLFFSFRRLKKKHEKKIHQPRSPMPRSGMESAFSCNAFNQAKINTFFFVGTAPLFKNMYHYYYCNKSIFVYTYTIYLCPETRTTNLFCKHFECSLFIYYY